jgi:hypothetical protein
MVIFKIKFIVGEKGGRGEKHGHCPVAVEGWGAQIASL